MMCFSQSKRNSSSVSPWNQQMSNSIRSRILPVKRGRRTNPNHGSLSSSSPTSDLDAEVAIESNFTSENPTLVNNEHESSRTHHRPPSPTTSSSTQQLDSEKIFLRRQQGVNYFYDERGNSIAQISWKVPVSSIDPNLNCNTSLGRISQLSSTRAPGSRFSSTQNTLSIRSRNLRPARQMTEEECVEDEKNDTLSIESINSLERHVEDIEDSDLDEEEEKQLNEKMEKFYRQKHNLKR